MAASTGAAELPCARRPRVAVVVTGRRAGRAGRAAAAGPDPQHQRVRPPGAGAGAGGEVAPVETVGDDYARDGRGAARALDADVVVTTGGVSVGPHDHVKPALAELGVEEVFWGVALRPGKPTWFGTRGRRPLVFGLPGNPVSAMVTFHLFVRPALARDAGRPSRASGARGVFDADYRKRPGRAHVVRCTLEAREDGWHVRPTKAQGSHVLTSHARTRRRSRIWTSSAATCAPASGWRSRSSRASRALAVPRRR